MRKLSSKIPSEAIVYEPMIISFPKVIISHEALLRLGNR